MQQVVNKTHKEDIYRSYANLIGKSGTRTQNETRRNWQTNWVVYII